MIAVACWSLWTSQNEMCFLERALNSIGDGSSQEFHWRWTSMLRSWVRMNGDRGCSSTFYHKGFRAKGCWHLGILIGFGACNFISISGSTSLPKIDECFQSKRTYSCWVVFYNKLLFFQIHSISSPCIIFKGNITL